uniref:Uncharacterized protein n=1 Tax=Oryza rufipogon TaxID=4529 RepID=A0A0E0RKI3_ORYRU
MAAVMVSTSMPRQEAREAAAMVRPRKVSERKAPRRGARLVVPEKKLRRVAARTLGRLAVVPMVPSFSNVSFPITYGIDFHPRYRTLLITSSPPPSTRSSLIHPSPQSTQSPHQPPPRHPRLLGAAAALSSSHHAAALSSSCDARLAPSSSRGARLSPPRHLPPATPDRHRRRRLLRIDSSGPSSPDLGDWGGYEAWRHHRYLDLPLCPLTQGNHGAGFAALAGAARFLSSERRTSAATDLAGAGCFLTEPSGKRRNRPPPSSSEAGHRCLQAEPTACAASSQIWSALPLLVEAQARAAAAVFSSRQLICQLGNNIELKRYSSEELHERSILCSYAHHFTRGNARGPG